MLNKGQLTKKITTTRGVVANERTPLSQTKWSIRLNMIAENANKIKMERLVNLVLKKRY